MNCKGMSENLEKARGFIEAYNRRDFDAAVEWFHPDIDWVLPARQAWDSCKGRDQVIRFFEGIDETFDELQLRPQEYHDAGDKVATRLRHYGRGKGSGAEIDTELYHQVATFRDGMIVRMEYFASWPEALEAAERRDEAPAEVKEPETGLSPAPPTR
jgi:ketosteroid isomerase-like protein